MQHRRPWTLVTLPYLLFLSRLWILLFLTDSYWSIAVSTTWRHCRRFASRRQAEWTPMLKGWTSLDTILDHVSRGRPLGLLHPAGGLLIAATTTLWWSSSYDLLARWPNSWSFLMCINLEAAEQPLVLLTSAFVTWRVYGMRNILLWRRMLKTSILSESCLVTVQVLQQYSRTGSMSCRDEHLCWLRLMTSKYGCVMQSRLSYADSSSDFCVTASISVLCASEVDEGFYKFHICVAYTATELSVRCGLPICCFCGYWKI